MENFKILTQQDMDLFIQALCRFLQKTESLLISLEAMRQYFDDEVRMPLSLSTIIRTLEDCGKELKVEIEAMEAAAMVFLGEARKATESVPVYVLRISLILNDTDLLSACLRRNNRVLV